MARGFLERGVRRWLPALQQPARAPVPFGAAPSASASQSRRTDAASDSLPETVPSAAARPDPDPATRCSPSKCPPPAKSFLGGPIPLPLSAIGDMRQSAPQPTGTPQRGHRDAVALPRVRRPAQKPGTLLGTPAACAIPHWPRGFPRVFPRSTLSLIVPGYCAAAAAPKLIRTPQWANRSGQTMSQNNGLDRRGKIRASFRPAGAAPSCPALAPQSRSRCLPALHASRPLRWYPRRTPLAIAFRWPTRRLRTTPFSGSVRRIRAAALGTKFASLPNRLRRREAC